MIKTSVTEERGCVSLVRGRNFSVLLQKVKIKIQNDVIVHPSASLSANEYVKIYFNQSNQCFNALKCQKCVIKIIVYCLDLFTFVFTKSLTKLFANSFVSRSIVAVSKSKSRP